MQSTPLNTGVKNPLLQLKFGTFQNATVTVNGQAISSGQPLILPADTSLVTLVVRRTTTGQPTTVPFAIVDGCGEWQTFVGGGTDAVSSSPSRLQPWPKASREKHRSQVW